MRGNRSQVHPALLRGHRTNRLPEYLDRGPAAPPPTAPRGLLPATRKHWRELWQSPVAHTWDRASDIPALCRYITNLDRWSRYEQLVAQAPIVRGSTGQLRANPLALRMDALEDQLRSAEDRFGLNAVSRLRLGIEVLDVQRELDRARAARMRRRPRHDPNEPDPRDFFRNLT
jgi:P27 family predicted phage terminase small subunit